MLSIGKKFQNASDYRHIIIYEKSRFEELVPPVVEQALFFLKGSIIILGGQLFNF